MPMRTLLLTVILVLGLVSCRIEQPSRVEAPADSAAGTTSFELAGTGDAALVVPIHINGQGPHQFVLDTGATMTCVNQALADSLDLPESAGRIGLGVGVGEAGRMQLVTIDSLRLGETKAFDLEACTLDLGQLEQAGLRVDGLLGLNFLKSFRVTLDFGSHTLHLEKL